MRIRIQSGSAAAFAMALAASLPPVAALADGPRAAYDDSGSTDASLDPGEEQMTADEENKARLQDLSDAYHNGYNARAKEDAETYASLRDQLKTVQKAPPADVPPLPVAMPSGDDARVTPIPPAAVAQRALHAPQPYRRLPPAQQYTMAPAYPQDAGYDPTPAYQPPPVYQQPVIVQQAYVPPPPPQPVVQYVPVYAQADYAPPPPVYQQPVITTVAAPVWSGYPPGYWGGYGYPRAYGYRVWR